MTFKANETLGTIVAKFPKAADIFHKYQIDYCCNGHKSLLEASKSSEINIETLIKELDKHYQVTNKASLNWNQASFTDLINHILQAHHAYLQTKLPLISENIKSLMRAHGHKHSELMDLFQAFQSFRTDIDMHLIKEETQQYPAIELYIKSQDTKDLKDAIDVIDELENDHKGAGNLLSDMRHISNQYQLPEDACHTYEITFNQLKELELNTFTHIHLENNILFPRLKNLLNELTSQS